MITVKGKKYQKNGLEDFMNNQSEKIEQHFSKIAALIGEKSRAIMLWNLLDGRAYTATELAACADISLQATSNHLSKLLKAKILTVEKQGRHKYYQFANDNIALIIENIANLLPFDSPCHQEENLLPQGIKYARTCYDHLAGKVGVQITTALLDQRLLQYNNDSFVITKNGENWFQNIGINIEHLYSMKRKTAFPCLDWSERKHHLGGALGATLLKTMLTNDWLRRISESREVIITPKGKQELSKRLKLTV